MAGTPNYRVMFYVDIPKTDVRCADEAFFHGINTVELAVQSGQLAEEVSYLVVDLESVQICMLDPTCDPDEDDCPTARRAS